MTLTQRLTRAGATFIVFGVVAAILPQQNGAAQATTVTGLCNMVAVSYRLTENSDKTDSGPAKVVASGTPVTLYSFYSSDGGNTYSPASANYTYVTTSGTINLGFGTSVTFAPASSGTVTALVIGNGTVQAVTYGITVN